MDAWINASETRFCACACNAWSRIMVPICFMVILWSVVPYVSVAAVRADAETSLISFVQGHGYHLEAYHDVVTEDSYLITVHRIPHGKPKLKNGTTGPVVVLMHGLMGSSADYISLGPQLGLSFLLADRGYDVWLPNARGTVFSRKHLKYNPDRDASYWDFSWHEIGAYDLPAVLRLITRTTNRTEFFYIGLSQGTTSYYVLASERPEFNRNFTLMISMAPIAYMGHTFSPIVRFLASFEPLWTRLSRLVGVNEVPPRQFSGLVKVIVDFFCKTEGLFQEICAGAIFLTGGFDYDQLNKSVLPAFTTFTPTSVSTRQLLHYAQNINSGRFRKYSYGRRGNLVKYNSTEPPSYDLAKITSRVSIYYGDEDWFADTVDVGRLCRELPNCVGKNRVQHPSFNHFDFLLAKDVVQLVYERIFKELEAYN